MAVYPAENKPITEEEKEMVEDKDKTEKKDSAETIPAGEKAETGKAETEKTEKAEAEKAEAETAEAEKVETEKTETAEAEKTEAEKVSGEKGMDAGKQPEKERKIEFLENPLPLPKKHEKRVMDYKLNSDKDLGGYDVLVSDDDDFDH